MKTNSKTNKTFASNVTDSYQEKSRKTYNLTFKSELDHDTLFKIRNRKLPNRVKITPNQASQVVKDYILPMFSYDLFYQS